MLDLSFSLEINQSIYIYWLIILLANLLENFTLISIKYLTRRQVTMHKLFFNPTVEWKNTVKSIFYT